MSTTREYIKEDQEQNYSTIGIKYSFGFIPLINPFVIDTSINSYEHFAHGLLYQHLMEIGKERLKVIGGSGIHGYYLETDDLLMPHSNVMRIEVVMGTHQAIPSGLPKNDEKDIKSVINNPGENVAFDFSTTTTNERTTSAEYLHSKEIEMEKINYREYKMPVIKRDLGLKRKSFLSRIFDFLAKRSMPYSYSDEYFRKVTIPKNPKQAEYMHATGFYPELKQYMKEVVDSNSGQLIEYQVDEKKYEAAKKKLNFI